MASDNRDQAETPFELPEDQIAVAAFRRRKTADEYALVVLSMKLPYWLHLYEGKFHLCVQPEHAEAVSEQLDKYRRENQGWKNRIVCPQELMPVNKIGLVAYVAIMVAFFAGQEQNPQLDGMGMMNTLKFVNDHEWWRAVTALTLHADVGHLAGNLLSGVCFGILLNQRFGYGLAWLLMLLSGILGNTVTAWMYYPKQHLSLGASTGLFGALGILVGVAMIDAIAHSHKRDWKRSLLPLAGGIAVLSFTGLSGDNTDVLGHVFGFVCGIMLGIGTVLALTEKVPGKRWQLGFSGLTLAILTVAWLAA